MDNPTFIGDNPSIPGEYKRNHSQFYPGRQSDVESTFTPSNQVHPKKISIISNSGNEKDALPDEIPVRNVELHYPLFTYDLFDFCRKLRMIETPGAKASNSCFPVLPCPLAWEMFGDFHSSL